MINGNLKEKRNLCLENGWHSKPQIKKMIVGLNLFKEIPNQSKTDDKIPIRITGCTKIVVVF